MRYAQNSTIIHLQYKVQKNVITKHQYKAYFPPQDFLCPSLSKEMGQAQKSIIIRLQHKVQKSTITKLQYKVQKAWI